MNLERLADYLNRASNYTFLATLVLVSFFSGLLFKMPSETVEQIVISYGQIRGIGISILILIIFTFFSIPVAYILKFYADRDDDGLPEGGSK